MRACVRCVCVCSLGERERSCVCMCACVRLCLFLRRGCLCVCMLMVLIVFNLKLDCFFPRMDRLVFLADFVWRLCTVPAPCLAGRPYCLSGKIGVVSYLACVCVCACVCVASRPEVRASIL